MGILLIVVIAIIPAIVISWMVTKYNYVAVSKEHERNDTNDYSHYFIKQDQLN